MLSGNNWSRGFIIFFDMLFTLLFLLALLILLRMLSLYRSRRSKRIFIVNRPLHFFNLVIRVSNILREINRREALLFFNRLRRNRLEFRRIVHRNNFERSLGRLLVASRIHHGKRNCFLAIPIRARSRNGGTSILDIHDKFIVSCNGPLKFIRLVIRVVHNLGKVHRSEFFLFLDFLVRDILGNYRRIVHRSDFVVNLQNRLRPFRVRHFKADLFRTVPILIRSRYNQLLLCVNRSLECTRLGNFILQGFCRMIRVRDIFRQIQRLEAFLFLDDLSENRSDYRRIVHGFDNKIHNLGIRCTIRVLHGEFHIAFAMPVRVGNIDVSEAALVNHDTERILQRFVIIIVIIILALLAFFAFLGTSGFRFQHLDRPRKLLNRIIRIANKLAQFNILELSLFTNLLRRNISQCRRIVHRHHFERNRLRSLCTIRVAHFEHHHFRSAPEILTGSNHRKHATCRNFGLELLATRDLPLEFIRLVIRILHELVKSNRLERFLFLDFLVRDTAHEYRRIVHAGHFKDHLVTSVRTFRVRHRERERFLAAPLRIRHRNYHGIVLAHIDLEISVARNFPLQG